MLNIDHIYHSYNNRQTVLFDINLSLDRVGVIGLLGKNGAGKSTLMNIISGTLHPTRGKVFIDGTDLLKNREKALLKIGFLPQKPPLYTNLTIEEYLLIAAQLRKIDKRLCHQRVDEVMDQCGITHMKHRLIKNLSGGYQQRVGIAQAVIHHPRIIILDEPSNGLDPNNIIEIRELIQYLSEESLILFSTHILSEIEAICQHIIMIENGRIVANDTMKAFKALLGRNSIIVKTINSDQKDTSSTSIKDCTINRIDQNTLKIIPMQPIADINPIIKSLLEDGVRIEEIYKENIHLENVYKILSKKGNQ